MTFNIIMFQKSILRDRQTDTREREIDRENHTPKREIQMDRKRQTE